MKPRFALLLLGAVILCAPVATQAGVFERLSESEFGLRGRIEFGYQDSSLVQKYKLNTSGYLWTPRFVQFDSEIKISRNVSPQFAGGNSSEIFSDSEYAGSFRFFPQHKFSPYFSAKKYTTLFRRNFGKDYETTVKTRQFGGNLKTKIPVSFDYSRFDNISNGATNTQDNFSLSARKSETGIAMNYDKNICDCGDKLSDYKYFRVFFDNNLEFANQKRRLSTGLSYSLREGAGERKDFLLAETLFIQHSRSLKSKYFYNFNSYVVDDYSFDNQKLRGELEYRYYRNFKIAPSFDLERVFGKMYNKNLKRGELSADYKNTFYYGGRKGEGGIYLFDFTFDYKISEEKSVDKLIGSFISVIGEKHSLTDEIPQRLEKRGINIASVIVIDSSELIIYRKDKDYFLSQEGGDVYISRNLSGDIPNNSEVIVSYNYLVPSGITEKIAISRGWSISRNFFSNSLRIYANQRVYEGSERSSRHGKHSNGVKTLTFGAALNRGQFNLTDEYVVYRQQGGIRYAYAKAISSIGWQRDIGEFYFSAKMANNLYFYKDGNLGYLNTNISVQRFFNSGLSAISELNYQKEMSNNKSSELRSHSQIDLHLRAWLMTVQYDYHVYKADYSSDNKINHKFYVGLARQFDVYLKGDEDE